MGIEKGRAVERSERQAEAKWHRPLRRPAATFMHRPRHRRQTASVAAGRANLRARPDLYRAYREVDRRTEERFHHRHRDPQYAAGGACFGLYSLYVLGRPDRVWGYQYGVY